MTISDELCYRFHSSIPWGNCTGQRYPDAGMLRTSLLHDVPRFRPQYLSTCHTHIDIYEGIASSHPTNPSESYNEGVEEKHCVYRPKMRLCWLSLLHQCFVSSLSHSEIRLTVSSPPRKRYPSLWIAVRIIVVAISLTRNGSPNAIWYSSDPRTIESGSLRRCSIARRRFPSRLSTARVKPWTVRSGHLERFCPVPHEDSLSVVVLRFQVVVRIHCHRGSGHELGLVGRGSTDWWHEFGTDVLTRRVDEDGRRYCRGSKLWQRLWRERRRR
mmetsp:Transcript_9557/g.18654  ORF Transcript_9557/g.18654 Transcript_9557/m.18654 type:complete len:271 (-) Transcript_9557:1912-2724(-)